MIVPTLRNATSVNDLMGVQGDGNWSVRIWWNCVRPKRRKSGGNCGGTIAATGWKRDGIWVDIIRFVNQKGNDVHEDVRRTLPREQWIPSEENTIKKQRCVRVAAVLKRSLEFERTKGMITLTKWHDMRTLRRCALLTPCTRFQYFYASCSKGTNQPDFFCMQLRSRDIRLLCYTV